MILIQCFGIRLRRNVGLGYQIERAGKANVFDPCWCAAAAAAGPSGFFTNSRLPRYRTGTTSYSRWLRKPSLALMKKALVLEGAHGLCYF